MFALQVSHSGEFETPGQKTLHLNHKGIWDPEVRSRKQAGREEREKNSWHLCQADLGPDRKTAEL